MNIPVVIAFLPHYHTNGVSSVIFHPKWEYFIHKTLMWLEICSFCLANKFCLWKPQQTTDSDLAFTLHLQLHPETSLPTYYITHSDDKVGSLRRPIELYEFIFLARPCLLSYNIPANTLRARKSVKGGVELRPC